MGGMALIDCRYFSPVLQLSTAVTVILPEPEGGIGIAGSGVERERYPVLYLLHGSSDDHTIWLRRTSIERYVASRGVAVVMPNVLHSWYSNQVHGYRFFDYLTEELPASMQRMFPISGRPEDTVVAGLSMGGYGAFKWALRKPDSIAAAASLSGGLDRAKFADQEHFRHNFGTLEQMRAGGDDLFDLVERADPESLPALWAWCGTEDFIYDHSVRFREHCAAHQVPLTYSEGPGVHDWAAWDEQIVEVLDWAGEVAPGWRSS